ncbi:MAG: PKD domain-containing protein [Thermoleophilaceae bacterium]|nr:PKD domain-containing protein [Thermoleophilaceae bacterium]
MAPALAAPDPSFTVSPDPPVSEQSATYTSTSTADVGFAVAKVEWDFDNDGTFEVTDEAAPWTATHTYPTAGTKTFVMKVTDNNALLPSVTSENQTVTVAQANRAPTSLFAFSPLSPLIEDDVLFASDASDPDGDALTYLWDFGDSTPVSALRNPIHQYGSPGSKTVTLKVTDPSGASATSTREIVVRGVLVPGNNPPIVAFAFSPRSPQVGDSVEFVSSTIDPEGQLREQAWDLDGDGEFDDARGDEVAYTFATPGPKVVRQRATDGAGASAIAERSLTVSPAPKARAGFLTPAPVVTLNGEILSRGMRVRGLSVRAPRGSLVTVKCRGKGCPAERRRKRVKRGTVRFKTYQQFLRAGLKLEIFVRKQDTIGDYTRYKFRAGKFPVRTDRCLPVGEDKPAKSCS